MYADEVQPHSRTNKSPECKHCKRVNNKFDKSTIYFLTSCNAEEKIAQNIIHNSNRTYKKN